MIRSRENNGRALAFAFVVMVSSASPARAAQEAGVEDLIAHAGAGAESAGMAGTGAALGRRTESLYFNPGGLDRIAFGEALLHRSFLPGGGSLDAVAAAWPFARPGTAALSFRRLANGGAVGRDADGVRTGVFGYERWELATGYGRALGRGLSAGLAGRFDVEHLASAREAGFALDAGVQYVRGAFAAGLAAQDALVLPRRLGPSLASTAPQVRFGLSAVAPRVGRLPLAASGAIDLEWIAGRAPIPRVGAELSHRNGAVRVGWRPGEPSVGASVDVRKYRVDWAAVFGAAGAMHRATVSMRIGDIRGERLKRLLAEEERRVAARAVREGVRRALLDEHLRAGNEALAAGLLPLALRSFVRAAEVDPNDESARKALAETRSRATTEAARARREGEAATAAFRWEEADRAWGEVLELEPGDRAAATARARARSELRGMVERAAERERELVRAREGEAAAKAQLNRSGGDLETARRRLTLWNRYAAGIAAYHSGRFVEAADQFEAVAASDPTFERVREFLRRARIQKDTPGREMPPELMALYREGLAYYLRGRYDLAIESWQRILAKDPTNPLAARNIEDAKRRLEESK